MIVCMMYAIIAIKVIIGNSDILIAVNRITDKNSRYVASSLAGVLKHDTPSQSYILACKELPKTNHSKISLFINGSLKIF